MIWSFKPNFRALKFLGHTAPVFDVAFSPKGDRLASASKDCTVRLWKPNVKADSIVFKGHYGAVRSVKFSNNGRMLLTSSDDKTVKLWNLPSAKNTSVDFACSFVGHKNWVRRADMSPDMKSVVSGSDDKTIKLWDVRRRECVHTMHEFEK
eukprot:TRINITY_DN2152_c0_g1_i1.p1 TRINITY_DN2152_c0_g1~~TRINITY_DN2152_c0_g1_i1.p1  ORF type:complete len:151 (+),score=33.54 TRINITY_DN2152_c0_g1_i1:3-455(+)